VKWPPVCNTVSWEWAVEKTSVRDAGKERIICMSSAAKRRVLCDTWSV
jgi:hypothetical protein